MKRDTLLAVKLYKELKVFWVVKLPRNRPEGPERAQKGPV
jgi:hypothetical protein